MRITHYGHACILVELEDTRLLFDPGGFSKGFEGVEGLDGVLFTHAHYDHLDTDRLPAVLERNPDAVVIADEGSMSPLEAAGVRARQALPGEHLTIGGVSIEVVGGTHAVIHPDIDPIPNAGFLLAGDELLHPGDQLVRPERDVRVLALPTVAPWMKLSEAVDYLREVSPDVAVPIHEALLDRPSIYYGYFERLGPDATEVRVPDGQEAMEL